MCGTLFSLHQFHTCGKFLTFSSLFPHIFLTLKFHSVTKAKVFTVVDVKSGYWHVVLDEESSHLTTFGTPNGRYRWLRLP